MGSRADKIPLARVKFNIIPEGVKADFKEEAFDTLVVEDPELPHIQRLYTDCFYSVFQRNPTDNISQYKTEISANARKAECSLRLFMLANMVGHTIHEGAVITNTQKARAAKFHAKLLTGERSIKRAGMYQAMCRERFGTFSLKSLSVLLDKEDKDDIGDKLYLSELTAAKWVVRHKIFSGADSCAALYSAEELQLCPEWLALEVTYNNLILTPYIERTLKKGTEAIERHRHSAFQTHTFYKRHLNHQKMAWIARQRMLPAVLKQVLNHFSLREDDILYPREPVTDVMGFWLRLALTIRQYHCWLYLNGEPSFFTPRRSETLVRRS